jgi:hypothetical protein
VNTATAHWTTTTLIVITTTLARRSTHFNTSNDLLDQDPLVTYIYRVANHERRVKVRLVSRSRRPFERIIASVLPVPSVAMPVQCYRLPGTRISKLNHDVSMPMCLRFMYSFEYDGAGNAIWHSLQYYDPQSILHVIFVEHTRTSDSKYLDIYVYVHGIRVRIFRRAFCARNISIFIRPVQLLLL